MDSITGILLQISENYFRTPGSWQQVIGNKKIDKNLQKLTLKAQNK